MRFCGVLSGRTSIESFGETPDVRRHKVGSGDELAGGRQECPAGPPPSPLAGSAQAAYDYRPAAAFFSSASPYGNDEDLEHKQRWLQIFATSDLDYPDSIRKIQICRNLLPGEPTLSERVSAHRHLSDVRPPAATKRIHSQLAQQWKTVTDSDYDSLPYNTPTESSHLATTSAYYPPPPHVRLDFSDSILYLFSLIIQHDALHIKFNLRNCVLCLSQVTDLVNRQPSHSLPSILLLAQLDTHSTLHSQS
jgi:hypothetical protein